MNFRAAFYTQKKIWPLCNFVFFNSMKFLSVCNLRLLLSLLLRKKNTTKNPTTTYLTTEIYKLKSLLFAAASVNTSELVVATSEPQ